MLKITKIIDISDLKVNKLWSSEDFVTYKN